MTLYDLAVELHEDIDTVMSWSYKKINGWIAYFEARHRRSEQEKNSRGL
jgi:hypothetical protein